MICEIDRSCIGGKPCCDAARCLGVDALRRLPVGMRDRVSIYTMIKAVLAEHGSAAEGPLNG
jgi:hypothetical protein